MADNALNPSPVTTPPIDAELPERAPNGPLPGAAIPTHFRRCFGCGDQAPGGLHLQAEAGDGLSVRGRLTITADHQGAPGLAHGGLLATAVDEVMGALSYLLMCPAVTGRLEVDYRRPVPVGKTLVIDARITGQSGRKVFTDCVIRFEDDLDGAVVGRAFGIFVQVPLEHFTAHGSPEHLMAVAKDPEHREVDWAVNP